jgi:hypothetical protein
VWPSLTPVVADSRPIEGEGFHTISERRPVAPQWRLDDTR